MKWTAIIPFKGRDERKTRLAGRLDAEQRQRLSMALFNHVSDVLFGSPDIDKVILLSDVRPSQWRGAFVHDEGRGLNAELAAAVAAGASSDDLGPVLVIHADLPFVTVEDIAAITAQARHGCAIAPDRLGTGTNALALHDPAPFRFSFGEGSFQRHCVEAAGCAGAEGQAHVVRRTGLALDVDTPEDLEIVLKAGFILP